MRAFVNAKAVIIGMGFLMEYIFPCWKNAMGAKVSENILAVTADAHDLEGKQQRMGIRVILNDNAGALQQMRPDWIFFAPPPSVAPGLTRDILLPYYESCRREGRSASAHGAWRWTRRGRRGRFPAGFGWMARRR